MEVQERVTIIIRDSAQKAESQHRPAPQTSEDVRTPALVEEVQKEVVVLRLLKVDSSASPFQPGLKLAIHYPSEKGVSVYHAIVCKRVLDRIFVSDVVDVTQLQRRSYYRAPVDILAEYRRKSRFGESDPIPARLKNLSGGGLCMEVVEPFLLGDNVLIDIPLGSQTVTVKGVIRHLSVDRDRASYLLGIQFVDTPTATQDKIVDFVFGIQRAMRRQQLER